MRALLRRFEVIVVRGARARNYIIVAAPRCHVHIIPGSVRMERFCPTVQHRAVDVVWVGRLVAVKHPEQLLEVLAEVKRRIGTIRAVIVGDGPLRGLVQRRAQEIGLVGDVSFAGHVDDVHKFLKDSKVFVLTSRSEGLSIAMAEAMAAGAVPVIPDVGDLAELVRSGETGWLVTPGAVSEYANRICSLLSDEVLRKELSTAARLAVRNFNDISAVARRWEEILVSATAKTT